VVRVWVLFITGTDIRYRIVAPWRDLLLVSQDAQGAVLEGLEQVFGRRFPRVLWVRVDCNACEHVIERFAPVVLCEVVDLDADAEEDEWLERIGIWSIGEGPRASKSCDQLDRVVD
jgi:hypothetical protein